MSILLPACCRRFGHPKCPPASAGNLRTEHHAIRIGGVRGIGPDFEQLNELGLRAVPELRQVGFVPHLPVFDRTLVATHGSIDVVVPILVVGGRAVCIAGGGGPGGRVSESGVNVQSAGVGFRHGIILNRPVVRALAGRLDTAPGKVVSPPGDVRILHRIETRRRGDERDHPIRRIDIAGPRRWYRPRHRQRHNS